MICRAEYQLHNKEEKKFSKNMKRRCRVHRVRGGLVRVIGVEWLY